MRPPHVPLTFLLFLFLASTYLAVQLTNPLTVDHGNSALPPEAPPSKDTTTTGCVETQFPNGTHHYCANLSWNLKISWTVTIAHFDVQAAFRQSIAEMLHSFGEVVENLLDEIPFAIGLLVMLFFGILRSVLSKSDPIPLVSNLRL